MAVLDEMKNMEDQKQEWMARLGEIYYKNCKTAGEALTGEAAEIVAKIDELDMNMKQLADPAAVEEPEEYQGEVCPKCGAPVEPDQVFCVNCGARLDEEEAETEVHIEASDTEEPQENTCPNCGAPVEEGQGFCIICGMKLGQSPAGGQQPGPERPAGPKICPSCGKVLPPQMHFCTSCGTKVD